MKVNKACGLDAVSPRLLKEGAPLLAGPLSILFNSLISKSYFPSQWKEGNLIPVYKKEEKNLPNKL